MGWYAANAGNGTQAVGQLLENELGLFDMSGNVYEWCEDDFHDNYEGAPVDGSAWIDQPKRARYAACCAAAIGWPMPVIAAFPIAFAYCSPSIAMTLSVFGWFSPEFRGWNPPSRELARPPGPCPGSKRSAAYKQGPRGGRGESWIVHSRRSIVFFLKFRIFDHLPLGKVFTWVRKALLM